jgi:glycosyltransferase involved in cell wall biosynthesis
MKVVMVSPYYYGVGGLQHYTYKISVGLRDAGIDVAVITCSHVPELSDNVTVYTVPKLLTVSNTPFSLRWFSSIKRIINKEDPDIVNGHTPVAYMADVALRVCGDRPYVLTYHNDLVGIDLIARGLVSAYYRLLGDKTIEGAKSIITTSTIYAENSSHLKGHLGKICSISPGVDIRVFNPGIPAEHIKDKYGLESDIVLFVGQLSKSHRHKGLSYLISAMANLDVDATLVVVGDGDWRKHYQSYARHKGVSDKVLFVGIVPYHELPLYYRGASVTVLPTYTQAEGFGMALIEANACGTPVIGTNVGGIPYVIEDERNGLLVEPKNVEALSTAITRVLKDTQLAERLGNNGCRRVRDEFTWERSVRRTIEVYQGVINV